MRSGGGQLLGLLLIAACDQAEPRLESVRVENPPAELRPGQTLIVSVTAHDAGGEEATIDAYVVPQMAARPRRVASVRARFEADVAAAELLVEEHWFALEGRSEVFFMAVIGDQSARTPALAFELMP